MWTSKSSNKSSIWQGFGGSCITKEKRTSRWLDFKTATDLLVGLGEHEKSGTCEAGAFRYDASEVPESLPGVKVIRSFAKKVTKMEEAIEAGNVKEAPYIVLYHYIIL